MTDAATPYFPADVEVAEHKKAAARKRAAGQVEKYLARSGGRLACAHPIHRFAQVPDSPARLILPECAGRDTWLKARHEGIGGSEVGALIGINEHETAWSIWTKKVDKIDKDLSDIPAVEWGHRLENVVAQKTAEEIGLVSRFAGGLWAWPDKPHIRVTPDRFATKPRSWKATGIIECKTAGDDEPWQSGTIHPKRSGTGQAPLTYQGQLQWQMGILGLEIGWLGCYVSNQARDFFTVEVHFDKDWFGEMVDAADDLWNNYVLTGQMPLHDLRHPITEELLKGQHPDVVKASVQLPEDTQMWLDMYQAARAKAEAAEADLAEVKNWFRMMTADAGAGYLGDQKVVGYPVVNTSSFDIKRFREDHPEMAEKYTSSSTHRRLTIRSPKKMAT